MSLSIRSAELKDVNEIAMIHVETWKKSYRGILPQQLLDSLILEDKIKKWQLWLNDESESKHFIVGCVDDIIMGFGSFCVLGDNIGEVEMLYVHPDAQGKHLGKNIMDQGLNFLRKAGCSKAILWVLRDNKKAQGFYEHNGWVKNTASKIKEKNGFMLNESCYELILNGQAVRQ